MRFMLPFFLIITVIALMFGVPSPALATEYFVKTNGLDSADGTNWALAFLTISNAVAQTEDDDIITVSNGTYGITAQIKITNGITVRGLNGATNTIVTRSSGTIRIFYINHSDVVIDGFTITNGYEDVDAGYAGGVYMTGGTVRNCIIIGCDAKFGGGLYMTAGVVTNCSIINNIAGNRGGGVYINGSATVVDCIISGNNGGVYKGGGVFCASGGKVRNCLISGNSVRDGGGVYSSGSTVESCTISRNTATAGPGGGIESVSATVKNTIIYFNTAPPGKGDNWSGSGTYSYNCTTPAVGGTSNITDDPLFVNYTNDNYRLLPGSPCIDAGQSNSWMAGAKDLDGTNRIIGATVDIGAYEFSAGDLLCGFAADSLEGFDPHTVVFTGYVSGSDTNGLGWQWDVDNNGSNDYQGPTVSVVTNTYTSGVYTVVLTVTNAVGETNICTRANYITVGPVTNYVDVASASPAFPYASWVTAATNIQAAVDAGIDGTLVLVTNGTYEISSRVTISKGVTVQSVNGADVTTIKSIADNRSVYLGHVDAVVDGFTLTKGSQTYGGGVYISYGGTVRNCIIKNNKQNITYGIAVTMMYGGTVSDCAITGNTNTYAGGGTFPGGVYVLGGTLRNCLIAYNLRSGGNGGPGGVNNSGGTVDNCTIVGNRTTKDSATIVGGLYMSSGTMRNSIIYFNTNTVRHSSTNWYKTDGTITYTCTTPAASGTSNITDNPTFKNVDAGDYRLRVGSPCVDVGQNKSWMTNACDLGGYNRIANGTVDIGAYELRTVGTIIHIR